MSACMPIRREPAVPRVAAPERIEVAGGALGRRVLPVPAGILGPVNYDLPVEANTWVEAEMNFLLNQRRETMSHWMDRADFYQEFVESVMREQGVPTDLVHLGMIESGYIPTARSSAGAVGIWQFMPATSRDMDLRVDNTVDERMDPVRSTRAAARYLRTLYRLHGDWALAAAAYNAGTGRISRSMERSRASNFWDLATRGDLAAETQHYVPRLYATTIIARDRVRFGFPPPRRSGAFAFDSIHVDLSISLGELAEMTGVDGQSLSAMNPHLRRGMTPTGGYWVWVPEGSGERAQRAYVAAAASRERLAAYTVRRGDSLYRIADRSGIPSAEIRRLNRSVDFDRLQAGAVISIPAHGLQRLTGVRLAVSGGGGGSSTTSGSAPSAIALSTVARTEGRSSGEARIHVVRRGDTLSELAVQYGVTVARIQAANSLRGTVIQLGQRLTIPAAESARVVQSAEHTVVAGDTLWEIARRYGSTIQAIEEANSLGDGPIVPGQRLAVPVSPP
jgi:membrane-bound lytic murein transglycosylase D